MTNVAYAVSFKLVTSSPLYLRRIEVNSNGYDPSGAYWGIGQPLWYVEDQYSNGQFFRAKDRDKAKAQIIAQWPNATFYR